MPEEQTTEYKEVTTQTITPAASTDPNHHKTYTKKKAIFRIYQIIWYILGVIEVLLVARFILKALGASPLSSFGNLIYSLSAPLALPFKGIFLPAVSSGSVFEWSTIIACFVYAVIAYGVVQLFQLVKPTTPQEVEQKVNQ